ncbi:MAG: hypothetical protein EBU75_11600 [Betaproteobacteria bacterium]|nr:hypothetical protein [Betaproteobacteria bacterium]
MAGFRSFAAAATVAAAVSAISMPAMAEQNFGAGLSANPPVAVVVKVPTPWYAPRFLVTSFEVVLALDNTPGGTPANANSSAVATIVEISIPAGVSKDRIAQGYAAAVPSFQKVPGLLRKYFITTADGKFGGIYIWKDEASATAWFTPAWRDRVLKEYGQPASLEWFDTPILLPGQDAGGAWVKGAHPS